MTTAASMLAVSASPGAMCTAAFDAWEPTLSLDTNVSFALWGARRVAEGIEEEPASAWFVDRLGDFLSPVGIRHDEVQGATDLPAAAAHRLFRQVAEAQDRVRAKPRNFTLRQPNVTLDDVRRANLPPELQHLRETPLDRDHGDEYPGMDGRVCARLLGMHTARMQVLATVVLAIHRSFHPFARLDRLLKSLEGLEELFEESGENFDDADAVARVLDAYYVHRTLRRRDTDKMREDVVGMLLSSRSLLLSYMSLRPEHRDAISAILPVVPSKDCEFERRHRLISREIAKASSENRKRFSDPLADRLDPILSACRVRRDQVRRMELRCREIESRMLARDASTDAHVHGDSLDFFYRDRVVTPAGRRLMATQRVHFRAHRESALSARGDPDTIVFEYLRVEGDGPRRHDPWFVELFASGALLKPTRLPVRRRDRRRATIVRLDLPDLHDKPAGLAGIDGRREAELFGRMLAERDMVLIPVRAMSHAMTLAYLMVRIMAYSFCRIGEALQITYHVADKEHWVTIHVDGKAYQAFLAIPKLWDETDEFLINDTTARLIATLALMTKGREPEGRLQPSRGAHSLADHKKDGEKLYVFSFRGRPITGSDMNYLFRILTAGFGKLRSHDIRHAAANCADEEKMGMETIKLLLRHRGDGEQQARKYARKTKAQLDRAKAEFFRRAEARDALANDHEEECGM